MARSQTEQLAPLSGVAAVALIVVSWLLINNYEFLPAGDEIKEFLTDNSDRIFIGTGVGVIAAVFLIWFAGSLRETLRVAERGTGRVSAIAFGGGVAGGAAVIIGYSALMSAAARAGDDLGISEEAATALFDLSGVIFGQGLPVALAAMLAATAVVAFRTGVFPAWMAWTSAIFALGSVLILTSWIFIGPDLLWIVYVSIVLYTRGREPAAV